MNNTQIGMKNETLVSILKDTRRREKAFQDQNSIDVKDIVKQYPAMNGLDGTNNLFATCIGSFPGSTFENDGENSVIQLNFIKSINDLYKAKHGSFLPSASTSTPISAKSTKSTSSDKNMNDRSYLVQDLSAQGYYMNELKQGQRPLREDFMNVSGTGQSMYDMQYSSSLSPIMQNGPQSQSGQNGMMNFGSQGPSMAGTNYQTNAQQNTRQSSAGGNEGGIGAMNAMEYQNFANQFNQSVHKNVPRSTTLDTRNQGLYDTSQFGLNPLIVEDRNQFNEQNDPANPNNPMDHSQFISSVYVGNMADNNGPESMYMQDLAGRPISDFTHNNMVPFGSKFTQNMAGTGVRSGNYIDGVTFDSGSDMSTPMQTKLATFTGNDDTYMHKREAPTMYSPAEMQTNYVYGRPLTRPDLDQYTQSMTKRRELTPIQSEQVGPGLNVDPSIPANGGFHDFTRVMPNNVSDYKANQLEGRINAGRLIGSGLPTSYPGIGTNLGQTDGQAMNTAVGVVKNRPPSFWSQARRPTMTTKVSGQIDGPLIRPEYQVDFRPNNAVREQSNYGFGTLVVPDKRTITQSPAAQQFGKMNYGSSSR